MIGKKDDQNLYEKVDYSMVPIELILCYFKHHHIHHIERTPHFQIFTMVHNYLNNVPTTGTIRLMLNAAIDAYGIQSLAVSLGLGVAKYKERDNWKKFDSDPDRFLRATLRHLIAIMLGAEYDGEKFEGYHKGNDHRGAVCFSLMVADHIINQLENPIQKVALDD